MPRTLQFAGELTWPLEDGKQAAKTNISASLVYTSALMIEKQFSIPAVDQPLALPMAGAKFVLLQATTADVNVKLNDLGVNFTTHPWNAMGWFPVSFYPFILGLAYFLPATAALERLICSVPPLLMRTRSITSRCAPAALSIAFDTSSDFGKPEP